MGYIKVEHTGILQQGKASPNMLLISTDEHASRIERLIEAIHGVGVKIVVQINHAGRQTASAVTGSPIVGPSPIPCPTRDEIPRELSVSEIEEIIEAYSIAAQRVKNARADGVELHMAHGYLICSFLSPFSNKRADQYGGSLENRAKFAIEVLTAIREKVGNKLALEYRISANELVAGGMQEEDTIEFVKLIEDKIIEGFKIILDLDDIDIPL